MYLDWNVMMVVLGFFLFFVDIVIVSFYSKLNSVLYLCVYKRGDIMEVILLVVFLFDYFRNSLIKKIWDDVNIL